ncbi:MAG: tRNA lysidine(34) synthetase TilS [Prevotella sp.]|nr:tRNA lysidine(34) synthetase TilS [Prevotella sp.]
MGDFIAKNRLLDREKRYLVALSGGADSVCLLRVLQRLGYTVEAAHCNFQLRGEESNRDERFCASLCRQQNIPFHRTQFDTKTYAREHGVSIEMAARELRYHYFHELLETIGFQGVCVAHHLDDNAETILLNLVRGTGLHGLTGMSPRRDFVLRPMLGVSRDEIVDYLRQIGQPYVTDSTNLQPDHVRNKIRLQVVPLLKEINPSVVRELCTMASHLTDAETLLNHTLDQTTTEFSTDLSEKPPFLRQIDVPQLLRQPSPAYALYHLLSSFGFNRSQMGEILASAEKSEHSGRQWHSSDHTLTLDRDSLVLSKKSTENASPIVVSEAGEYVLDDLGRLRVEIFPKTADFIVDKRPQVAVLDADKASLPLTLRKTQTGDRFVPFGMRGSKLVSDYLTDRKKSLPEKKNQWVLTDESGQILWLAGERTDNRFAVSPQTKTILRLTLIHL